MITTDSGASARLALRDQAWCTVGTGDRESEVKTRPSAGILLRQLRGVSSCGTAYRAGIELCTLRGCNTELRTRGVMIASVLPEEATASLTESVHRRIRIVSCAGFISVRAGGQLVAGGASGRNRYVIEIDEYSYRTEDETRIETPTEIRVESQSGAGETIEVVEIGELPGRGPCQAKFVQREERELRE